MPTLREVQYLTRRSTIDAALSEAVTALPGIAASRFGSTPDDRGSGGYSADDASGRLTYSSWFGPGDFPGTSLVRPY